MGRLSAMPARVGQLPPRIAALPKTADPFYRSPEWRALVKARTGDADWIEAKARAKPGEWLVLDHIREIKDGGAKLDPANTQWLTHSEHQAKTAKARANRARGRTGGG